VLFRRALRACSPPSRRAGFRAHPKNARPTSLQAEFGEGRTRQDAVKEPRTVTLEDIEHFRPFHGRYVLCAHGRSCSGGKSFLRRARGTWIFVVAFAAGCSSIPHRGRSRKLWPGQSALSQPVKPEMHPGAAHGEIKNPAQCAIWRGPLGRNANEPVGRDGRDL